MTDVHTKLHFTILRGYGLWNGIKILFMTTGLMNSDLLVFQKCFADLTECKSILNDQFHYLCHIHKELTHNNLKMITEHDSSLRVT